MNTPSHSLWTIEELGAQVALALSVDYEGQDSGRVRDVPDQRTIRYYTTLGLIDRPAEMRGRVALYGRRHLLQLVAIKRLQSKGQSLAELQAQLMGLTDSELGKIANLPIGPGETLPERRSETFWKDPPAPPSRDCPTEFPIQGIRLDADVTLLVTPSRTLESDDLEAIRAAAGPLLKVLDKRRLRRRAR